MSRHYELVATRAAHRCEYCQAPEIVFNFPFEVEHVTPLTLGGAHREHNWALACRACNIYKGVRVGHVDPATDTPARLYHPRRDVWSAHFRIDVAADLIEGRTPVGRATVALLRMNGPAQRAARQRWSRLGLFP